MITYDRLWQTMKQRGISQYDLYTHYNVNRSQLNRLRHNENVEVNTIDKLCNILQCRVEDIMEHFPDDNRFWRRSYHTKSASAASRSAFCYFSSQALT